MVSSVVFATSFSKLGNRAHQPQEIMKMKTKEVDLSTETWAMLKQHWGFIHKEYLCILQEGIPIHPIVGESQHWRM